MTSKREDLEINIRATDRASSVVSGIADSADKLDGRTVDVTVEADDKATADVRALMARIDSLTDDDKKVILTAEAKKLDAEVKRATILLGKVDGEEATAVLDARNAAQAKLDAVNGELDTLDRRSVDATVDADDRASGDIRRVTDDLDTLDRKSVDATIDVEQGSGFQAVADKLGAMPGQVGSVGSQLGNLSTKGGAAAAFVGMMLAAANHASETATTVDNIATFTGDSHEEASRLWAVWSDNKLEVGDLLDIVAQMTGVLADSPEIARRLGLNLDGSRTPLQLLVDAVDALNSDQLSANERILLGSQLFGEEGTRQINGLVAALGTGGLQGAIDDVDPGRLYSEADAEKARALTREWTEFTGKLQEFAATIGPPALDFLTRLADGANTLADGIGTVFGGVGNALDYIRDYDIGRLPWDQGDDDPPFWAEPGVMDQVIADAREHAAAEEEVAPAVDRATESIEDKVAALEDEQAALQESIDLSTQYVDAQSANYDAAVKYREATQAQTEAVEKWNEVNADAEATDVDRREAGERVVETIVDAANAYAEMRQKASEANGVIYTGAQRVRDQNAEFARQASTIDASLLPQLAEAIATYNGIPDEVETVLNLLRSGADPATIATQLNNLSKTYTATVAVEADEWSLKQVDARLNNLARLRNARIGASGNYDKARASGDPYTSKGRYLVGDEGRPEIIDLPDGARITPLAEAAQLGGPPTFITNNTTIHVPPGTTPDRVVNANRRYQRIQGTID